MMRVVYCFLLFIILCSIYAQDRKFFNIVPDIGAIKGQCVFSSIHCDSNSLFIVGDEVYYQDSNGRNKKVRPHLTRLDYQGNIIYSKLIDKVDFTKPYARQNYPLFKRNDSIYYYNIYNWDDTTFQYLKNYIIAIDMWSGKIIHRVKVEEPVSGDIIFTTLAEMDPDSKVLTYVFRHTNTIQSTTDNYIYTYTDSLVQLSRLKIKDIGFDITPRYIRYHQGYYHLIGETTEVTGNGMIYLKVDTTGSVIKSNKLNTEGKIYTGSGFTYSIIKSIDDRGYYVVTNDHLRKNNATLNIPYVLHVSLELDTVFWRTRFQHPLLLLGDNYQWINNACLLNDKTGIITCGSLGTPPFAEPSYGCIFKCSLQGDSMWTRLIQPLGWDSLRALWMSIESIRTTPYNTIVACGRVSDGQEGVIKGWLLHLDSEGCLIPGCDKLVKNEDIKTGLVQSFTFYPTLINSDKLYVLSNVQSESSYNLQLTDLQGRIIKSTKLKALEGTQYVLPVTEDIPNGEYILSITGIDFNQSEKIIIAR